MNERHVELLTERTVERFLMRFFLREARFRSLYLVAPFIAPLRGHRFSLADLRQKAEDERIPTYVITREPADDYQHDAMNVLLGSPWVELRYNASIHAKLFVAGAERESDSFALMGSGNLTSKSIESNIELGMLIYSRGHGKQLLHDLNYWAGVRLRTLEESRLIQSLRACRR